MRPITEWKPEEVANFQVNLAVLNAMQGLKSDLGIVDFAQLSRETAKALKELDSALYRVMNVSSNFPGVGG